MTVKKKESGIDFEFNFLCSTTLCKDIDFSNNRILWVCLINALMIIYDANIQS